MPFNPALVKNVCKRVPPFASGQDFNFWFEARFLRVCAQEACNDLDKLEALLSLVPSSVYSKLVELSSVPDATFAEIAAKLRLYLSDEPSPSTALRMIRTLKQEPGEVFRGYIDRLLRLAKLAHPDSASLAEREVCLQASTGASCPKLRADLAYENPETLEKLFEMYRKRKAAEESRVSNVLALQIEDDDRRQVAAAAFDFSAIISRLEAIEKALASTQQRKRRPFSGRCYNCDESGHRAAECSAPKRDQPVRNSKAANQNL